MLNFIFKAVPVFSLIIFAFIFIQIIKQLLQRKREWTFNNNSPVLTVEAMVTAKRMEVKGYIRNNSHSAGLYNDAAYTEYYAAFEVESGDRLELLMPSKEYGLLVENDFGRLTFRGTRFISFDRIQSL